MSGSNPGKIIKWGSLERHLISFLLSRLSIAGRAKTAFLLYFSLIKSLLLNQEGGSRQASLQGEALHLPIDMLLICSWYALVGGFPNSLACFKLSKLTWNQDARGLTFPCFSFLLSKTKLLTKLRYPSPIALLLLDCHHRFSLHIKFNPFSN